MGHFFIKRGNNLHGPYSESQIQSGVDTGKLKASDLISETSDGPWQSIDQFHAPKVDEEAIAGDEPLTDDGFFSQLPDMEEIPTTAFPLTHTHGAFSAGQNANLNPAAEKQTFSPDAQDKSTTAGKKKSFSHASFIENEKDEQRKSEEADEKEKASHIKWLLIAVPGVLLIAGMVLGYQYLYVSPKVYDVTLDAMTPSEGNGDSRNRLEASDIKAAMEMILGEDGKTHAEGVLPTLDHQHPELRSSARIVGRSTRSTSTG